MKNERFKKFFSLKKRTALLLAAAMLLPMFAVGCESAHDIIKKRERADEISKRAVEYMQEKYNRGFNVKKCEAAEGDEYEGDFLISFNSGVHAFYDSDEDMFYDDRQTKPINEAIMRDIWLPMFEGLDVVYENVNDNSQTFNMVYRFTRGGKETKYSMYHEYYDVTAQYYGMHSKLSVTTDNIIFVEESTVKCRWCFDNIRKTLDMYFKGQSKGSINIYAVTNEMYSKQDFDNKSVDETTEGCVAHLFYGDKQYCAFRSFVEVTEGLYGNVCHLHDFRFQKGDLSLIPVDDSEKVKENILKNMESKDMGLLDKYVSKKREINFEGDIYIFDVSTRVAQSHWKDITVAFIMKDGDGPIGEYAEINESEHSMFAYNMNGDDYNATCLCSPNSRSVMFTYKPGDEVYFWFGSQK